MAKGVPTARSQRFKATQKLQEKITSTPTTPGNDVLPSPISVPEKPTLQAEGAQHAFEIVRVLNQTLIHMSPDNHIYDILQLMRSSISACSAYYNEANDRNHALQQQLDEANSKLITQFDVQNAEILKLQDELSVSREKQDFYRRQAEKADLVPPFRRRRLVPTDSDNALTSDQLFQQVLWDRDDLKNRDSEISRLQDLHLQYEAVIDQLLLSTSTWLDRHEELCNVNLAMRVRQKVSDSAVAHYRNQLSECKAQTVECKAQALECKAQADHETQALLQSNTLLQELRAKFEKLAAQVAQEDPIVQSIVDHGFRITWLGSYHRDYNDHHLHSLSEQLLATRHHLRPKTRS